MDKKTNLREMDAPGVGSGKFAGDSILAPKGLAEYPLPAESGSNPLTENVTGEQPVKGASGRAAFK